MIIVTGGAGFIGSNIVAELQEQGYKDIVVIDRIGCDEKWKNIAKRELAGIVAPENTFSYLNAHTKEITAVIHMGAISTTTETDVDLIVRNNFELSLNLWNWCRDNRKQFIYASSAATYGDGGKGFKDDASLGYVNDLRPLNAYGWSKTLFDRKVAREVLEQRGAPLQYAGLKFFNVYGPNEYHKGGQKSVVAHIFPVAKAGKEVKLFKSYNPDYKDGWQLRDFVWVGDCVSVIMWLLKNPKVNGLFNVGTGKARSFYDLAKATWNALGEKEKISFVDMPEQLRGKYQYYTQADLTKLRQAGYTNPMTSLEDGVRQYVQNYLNKEDSYR